MINMEIISTKGGSVGICRICRNPKTSAPPLNTNGIDTVNTAPHKPITTALQSLNFVKSRFGISNIFFPVYHDSKNDD